VLATRLNLRLGFNNSVLYLRLDLKDFYLSLNIIDLHQLLTYIYNSSFSTFTLWMDIRNGMHIEILLYKYIMFL